MVARAAAGRIPEDGRLRRAGLEANAGGARNGRLDGRAEPDVAVGRTLGGDDGVGELREGDEEIVARSDVLLGAGDAPEALGALEAAVAEAAELGGLGSGGVGNLDRDRAAREGAAGHGEGERGGIAVRTERERGGPVDADAARAVGGDGVDAGAPDVALHGLDETGVDAAALFGLECDACLFLGDDDAVDHRAVDLERVAADRGAVRERERERRGDRARVGVADRDRRGDAGVEAVDLRVDVERVDGARLVRVLEGNLDPGARRRGRRRFRRGDDVLRDGCKRKDECEEAVFHRCSSGWFWKCCLRFKKERNRMVVISARGRSSCRDGAPSRPHESERRP